MGLFLKRRHHWSRRASGPHIRRAIGLSLLIAFTSSANAQESPPTPAAAEVESIVVRSKRLSVETLIDRKVYSVTEDVQRDFGSLSDILNVIPSIDVDADGIVSLRGDTNVLILIDGKPSTQFSGSAAGDNLQSIPAADIERIEVLTTPPAQFKADGAAGVINIITRKKHPEGAAGSAQASLGSGGRYVTGASSSYSSGPLAASLSAGYRQDYRQRLIESTVTAADATGALTESRSSINERLSREVPSVGSSVAFALNERQSLSGSVNWSDRGGLRTYTESNDSSGPADVITSSSQRLSTGHDPEIDLDEKLGFSQQFGPDETLDISLHRSTSHQHEHYDYTNDSFIPPAAPFYNNLDFHEDREITEFGADYAFALSKTRSLKAGYAFELDDYGFRNVGNNVDPSTGAQIMDLTLTDDFQFRQKINAAYASYQASLGAWNLLGGLRAELAHTDVRQVTDTASTPGSYFRVYPSLHVDRILTESSTLSFGASYRVMRPDPSKLDSYANYEYTPNLTSGNPNLMPQFTQSYELGYAFESRRLSYSATGYYRLNRDSATVVTDYLGNGFTLTTATNLPRDDSAGLEFTVNARLLPKLTCNVSGNLFYDQIDATALGSTGLQSTTGLNAKVKLDYRPRADDSAQITLSRTDKRLTPQGYIAAINLVNLGYKRALNSDLSAVATVSDIFNGQRFQRFATTLTYTQEYQRTVRGRILYLGLVYSFGAGKKDKQPSFEYDQS